MATQPAVVNILAHETVKIIWAGLANLDDGAFVSIPWRGDKTVHAFGTFGVGGSVAIEGSNEATPTGANAGALTNAQETAIALTNVNPSIVLQSPQHIRCRVTAGDGTTSLSVVIIVRGERKL